MSAPVPVSFASYCARCGYKLDAGAGFCAACGASRNAHSPTSANAKSPAIGGLTSSGEDIEAFERSAAENPDDEVYRKLLAVALHDDAMKDWWEEPEDKSLLCVSLGGLRHARNQLKRASQLQFNDPPLRRQINERLQLVDSMEKREFVGSWLMVVALGLFYVIPGAVWWYVNRRPGYLINNDYVKHRQTGKHRGAAARMGGLQGKIYEFFENTGEWGWVIGLFFMLTIGVVLSPVFMILAYKQNYLDVKNQVA